MPALTNEQKLADAESQYHLLLTGQKARVFVDQNGERVEFSVANRGSLAAYIESLKSKIGSASSTSRGPLRAFF